MATKQKRKPVALETGKRYKGSAVVNDFGEIQFTPYQSLPEGEGNGMKILLQTKDYTLYHSEKSEQRGDQWAHPSGLYILDFDHLAEPPSMVWPKLPRPRPHGRW